MFSLRAIDSKVIESFWAKVEKTPTCWVWKAYRLRDYGGKVRTLPYGNFRQKLAHRVAWVTTYGSIPRGMQVAHKCDNPPCVRPSHLFLTTNLGNVSDAVRKGRHKNPPVIPGPKTEIAKVRMRAAWDGSKHPRDPRTNKYIVVN